MLNNIKVLLFSIKNFAKDPKIEKYFQVSSFRLFHTLETLNYYNWYETFIINNKLKIKRNVEAISGKNKLSC